MRRDLAAVFGLLAVGCATAADQSPFAQRLGEMLQVVGKDYTASVRITSRAPGGPRSVARLKTERRAADDGDRLVLWLEVDDARFDYCLQCAAGQATEACTDDSSSLPMPELDATLPGTLLPWEEVLAGACSSWQVTEQSEPSAESAEAGLAFDIALTHPPHGLSWATTRAWLDPETGEPLRFDRIDRSGGLLRRVHVLKMGTVSGWDGIRLARIEMPQASVLMEVRSFKPRRSVSRPTR